MSPDTIAGGWLLTINGAHSSHIHPDDPTALDFDYLRQMAARTDHEGVSFIDLSAVLPAARPGSRYYIDGLHPSADGQPLIASSLVEALAPEDEQDTPGSAGTGRDPAQGPDESTRPS